MGYYLFAILPNICGTLSVLIGVLSIPLILLTGGIVVTADYEDDFHKFLRSVGRWFYPLYIVIMLLNVFVPSQKQLAFIIAAPYIVENEDLQQAGKNTAEIVKLGTEYLKEILNDSNGTDNKTGTN